MGNNSGKGRKKEEKEEKEDRNNQNEDESEHEKKEDGFQNFIISDNVTPLNMLMQSPPKRRNKIEEPTEYIEPSNEYDINKDNWKNRQLMGFLYDQRTGLLSVNGGTRRCDFCKVYEGNIYYHCFKCDDYDLCEKCFEAKNGYHEHDGEIDYFHKMTEAPQTSRYKISRKENSVEAMLECFSIYSDRYFIGTRKTITDHMTWIKFHQIHEMTKNFIRGSRNKGLEFKKNEYFGFLSLTCVEWIVSDFSCFYCGMISVPIHYTLSYEEKKYIVNLTSIKYLLISNEFLEEGLALKKECESLEHLILVSSTNETDLLSFSELENIGSVSSSEIPVPYNKSLEDDDIVSVIFTSGTTSKPKGVVLTEKTWRNRNSRINVFPLVEVLFGNPSHMSARLLILSCLVNGGRFSILTNNDLTNLFEDIQYTSPTYISCPPRILNFIYDSFKTEVKKKILLLEKTREISKEEEEETSYSSSIKKIKDETFLEFRKKKEEFFGKSCMIISTGGAPTSTKVKRFIRMISDIPVYEGYGISEVGSVMYNGSKRREMKLVDCPDLGYLTTDKPFPRGEIVIKDDGSINRYFTDDLKNRRIDDDGFYHTGDIAEEVDGTFVLIDRKSNIIKLSNGEFFSIEKIENLLKEETEFLEEILVFPNKLRTKLFGICRLSEEEEEEEEKKEIILEMILKVGEKKLVPKWQLPSNIILIQERFTIENKMLTISSKKNRKKILEYFSNQIKSEFQENENQEIENWVKDSIGIIDDNNKTFEDYGLDSLSAIRLMNEVKIKFNQTLSFQDLMNSSVHNLVEKFKNLDDNEIQQQQHEIIRFEDEIRKSQELKDLIKGLLKEEKDSKEEEEEGEEEDLIKNDDDDEIKKKNIFLTGSTGFVGSFILKKLLKNSKFEKIYCLVRKRRTRKLLLFKNEKKIEFIEGDLSKLKFGLSSEKFKELGRKIDVIIHCGAYVNHFLNYDDLFDVNVRSSFDILKLLCDKKKQCIHYISSQSVFTNNKDDVGLNNQIHLRKRGYSSTKYISDCIFQKFSSSSSVVVVIHRLNLIGFSKIEGTRNKTDWFNIFLDLIFESKMIPLLDHDILPMDIHSVDFISSCIIDEVLLSMMMMMMMSSHKEETTEKRLKQINYSMKNCSMKEFIEFILKFFQEEEEIEEKDIQKFSNFNEWIENIKKFCNNQQKQQQQQQQKKVLKYLSFVEIWKRKGRIGPTKVDFKKKEEEEESKTVEDKKYSYEEFRKMIKLFQSCLI